MWSQTELFTVAVRSRTGIMGKLVRSPDSWAYSSVQDVESGEEPRTQLQQALQGTMLHAKIRETLLGMWLLSPPGSICR